MLPWYGDFTGFDLIMGNAPGMSGDYHRFLLIAVPILSIIGLIFSVRGIMDRSKTLTGYGWLLFGFILLALVVLIGMWAPEGEKINTLGGVGLYLCYASVSLFIVYGIIEYSTRAQS